MLNLITYIRYSHNYGSKRSAMCKFIFNFNTFICHKFNIFKVTDEKPYFCADVSAKPDIGRILRTVIDRDFLLVSKFPQCPSLYSTLIHLWALKALFSEIFQENQNFACFRAAILDFGGLPPARFSMTFSMFYKTVLGFKCHQNHLCCNFV